VEGFGAPRQWWAALEALPPRKKPPQRQRSPHNPLWQHCEENKRALNMRALATAVLSSLAPAAATAASDSFAVGSSAVLLWHSFSCSRSCHATPERQNNGVIAHTYTYVDDSLEFTRMGLSSR
jgi:hypothetical protein